MFKSRNGCNNWIDKNKVMLLTNTQPVSFHVCENKTIF